MSVVVTDTSPVRALAVLDLLTLLPRLFGEVFLPPRVAAELAVSVPRLGSVRIEGFPFIHMRMPADQARVGMLAKQVDAGEAEAIALALELKADYLLIDDAEGRRLAASLGLVPLGALGVLVRARQAGLVTAVAPLIVRLRTELEFRVSDVIVRKALDLAGE